tara:strand:+ start:2732 stop:4015 length:1284 start_codon:yes stop_codon:yes gene_type:complete
MYKIERLSGNFLWLLLDKAIVIVGGLLVGIWVARYLGPSDFGVLQYSLALIAFLSFLSQLGLNQIVVRELTKSKELAGEIIGTCFVLKALGGLLSVFLIVFFAWLLKGDSPLVFLVIVVVSLTYLFQAFDVATFYFESQLIGRSQVLPRILSFLIGSILQVSLILFNAELVVFALLISLQAAMLGVFQLLAIRDVLRKYPVRFSCYRARRLLQDSWVLMLSTFLIVIYTKIDQIMIEHYLGLTQVGIFSVAVRLSEVWYFFPAIIVSTLLPYFVRLREQDLDKYQAQLRALYSFMFWLGVTVGVLVIVFGESGIKSLFGSAYIGAYEALVLNVWSGIFVSQALARGIWMISENLQRYRLYGNIAGVTLNILCNILLIPRYGIAGAAFASLVTQGVGTWIVPLFFSPMRKSTLDLLRSVNPRYLFLKL